MNLYKISCINNFFPGIQKKPGIFFFCQNKCYFLFLNKKHMVKKKKKKISNDGNPLLEIYLSDKKNGNFHLQDLPKVSFFLNLTMFVVVNSSNNIRQLKKLNCMFFFKN